jgi:hypothetical protein
LRCLRLAGQSNQICRGGKGGLGIGVEYDLARNGEHQSASLKSPPEKGKQAIHGSELVGWRSRALAQAHRGGDGFQALVDDAVPKRVADEKSKEAHPDQGQDQASHQQVA